MKSSAFIVLLLAVGVASAEKGGVASDGKVATTCENPSDCDFADDDLELTTLEAIEEEGVTLEAMGDTDSDISDGRSGRQRRQSDDVKEPELIGEPLEKDFQFTDDKQYFYDLLDGTPPHDKAAFHKKSPEGYAETDRTKLLLFDVRQTWYPPFTYRGLFGRSSWHKIPIDSLMKKRNRSFMLLNHECEHKTDRKEEKDCAKEAYPKLPSCKSEDQSPIDIDTTKARDSSLKEFTYTGLKGADDMALKYPFLMSVPWDGTDILTVELLGSQEPPSVEKGSISGRKLHLERIHIHYGENETVGSEHTLNNATYAMELQFIFTLRNSDSGVRGPTDLQYWDLLMQYYTEAGEENRLKDVHIIALWVRVIDDERFEKGRGDWNDKWNKDASKAFGTLSRAARKFWAIHNTLQEPSAPDPDPANPNPDPNPANPNPDPNPANPNPANPNPANPNPANPNPANPNPANSNPAPSSRKRRQGDSGSGDAADATPPSFKYRAVMSTGPEQLELGAFFPPQVFDAKQEKWRDSIYYNYKGSITHPPCFAYVEWDIYDRPLYIPTSMWINFLYIHSEFDDTKYIAGNYRLPRHVYVEALDSKRSASWTSKNEEERQKVLERMSKRDLRKSKPTGADSENYDYDDGKSFSGKLTPGHLRSITLLLLYQAFNKATQLINYG